MKNPDESDNTVLLQISWDLDALGGLLDQIEALSEARSWAPSLTNKTMLVLEELIVNALTHGGRQIESGVVRVHIDERQEGLMLEIYDNGDAFDPLVFPAPDLDADLDSRPVGGLGVFLTMQLSSSLSYERIDGFNHVSLCLKASP
jgi:serine/threonine-protein kinase RsbW